MLDYTKYENKVEYPNYSVWNEKKELKELLLKIENLSPAQQMRVKELEDIINKFEAQKNLHYIESDRIYNLWKNDLFEEYGVKDNPKAGKALSIAWEYGHARGGYENVECYFSDLVELIK